jgi:exodeoxyribonuclease V
MNGIVSFMQSDDTLFSVDGEAGTGKTTMLEMIRDHFKGAIIAAPTNKACDVLRKKGFEPTTLDRVINETVRHTTNRPMTDAEIKLYDENNWIKPHGDLMQEITYEKIEILDASRPVVLDESSMAGENQIKQLCKIASKVVCVGDSFQLPPVEDKPWFQNKTHDAVLDEIVRTDGDSGIARLCQALRRKDPNWRTKNWGDEVTIVPAGQFNLDDLKSMDVTIAHQNKTCDLYNSVMRELKGRTIASDPTRPVAGDTLLAWETDRHGGSAVTKGATYTVAMSGPCNGGYTVQFRELDASGKAPIIMNIAKANLMSQKTKISTHKCFPFSFAECITGHKSQGSEWDNVLVLAHDYWKREEPEYWNWLYTAMSRAEKHLTVAI